VTGGVTIFSARCSCHGNFSVEIDDVTGSPIDLPISTIGAYNGAVAEGLKQGSYSLNVVADGAWTVFVTQPRNPTGAPLPQTYTGAGQLVVGPFTAGSSVRIQAHNISTTGGHFSVRVLASDCSFQDLPFNRIGTFDGWAISNNLSCGPYWLDIDSDGHWSITVSNLASSAFAGDRDDSSFRSSGVVIVASRSLAFTGVGPGLKAMTLVGFALMLLGLTMFLLADMPRRVLRQLSLLRRGGWGARGDGGMQTVARMASQEARRRTKWVLGR